MPKCKIADNVKDVTLCPAMTKYVQYEGRPKGIRLNTLTNMKTGKSRVAYVTYHESAKDDGVVFNVCPWCGENLIPPETAKLND